MANSLNGATLSLIIIVYVLAILPGNSVEEISLNEAYKNIQSSRAPDSTRQYCSQISCRRAVYETEPRFGGQKRRVPTGPNQLHN